AAVTAISIALIAGGGTSGAQPAARLARVAIPAPLPHQLVLPAAGRPDAELARALADLSARTGLTVEIDGLTRRPRRARGGRIPWIPGAASSVPGAPLHGRERRAALLARAMAFVREESAVFALPEGSYAGDEEGTVSIEEHELDVVRLRLVDGEG